MPYQNANFPADSRGIFFNRKNPPKPPCQNAIFAAYGRGQKYFEIMTPRGYKNPDLSAYSEGTFAQQEISQLFSKKAPAKALFSQRIVGGKNKFEKCC